MVEVPRDIVDLEAGNDAESYRPIVPTISAPNDRDVEEAAKLLSVAAGNAGIKSQEALQRWYETNRLADRDHVFPRLLALLEQLVGDRWLFDRAPLQQRADATSSE